jgi:hypothetical protein
MMKRAVAARQDNDAIVIAGDEEIIKAAQSRDINVSYLTVGQYVFKLASRLLRSAVICQRIVKYNVILQGIFLRKNQFSSINILYHFLSTFSRTFYELLLFLAKKRSQHSG